MGTWVVTYCPGTWTDGVAYERRTVQAKTAVEAKKIVAAQYGRKSLWPGADAQRIQSGGRSVGY